MTHLTGGPLRSSSWREVVASHVGEAATFFFLSIYVAFGGSLEARRSVAGPARGIIWLWLPLATFLFCVLRNECADVVEAVVFSAVGSLGLTTGRRFFCDTVAVWWDPRKVRTPAGSGFAVSFWVRNSRAGRGGPVPGVWRGTVSSTPGVDVHRSPGRAPSARRLATNGLSKQGKHRIRFSMYWVRIICISMPWRMNCSAGVRRVSCAVAALWFRSGPIIICRT